MLSPTTESSLDTNVEDAGDRLDDSVELNEE